MMLVRACLVIDDDRHVANNAMNVSETVNKLLLLYKRDANK
jgi:hypothetical protein